jgi:ribonuclease D
VGYINIDSDSELLLYLKKIEDKKIHTIALDIEAESNLHSYGEKLCLIQIFDGVSNIIIDPFNISTDVMKRLFENTNILKVMYDAGSDLSLLKNTIGIEIKSILDLRPASELLDYEKKDLHSVVAFELGIVLASKRKYQKYNWMKRPISEQALEYAVNDVMYMLTLKNVILAKMYAKKLLETFLLKNLQIQNKDYTRNPEDKYRKISGYGGLQATDKIVFQRVFDIREKYAEKCDLPPHNVIRKTDLIDIVKKPGYIDIIRFPKNLRMDLIQGIVRELKTATKKTK